jgi:undecaprenyl-diphosphatase
MEHLFAELFDKVVRIDTAIMDAIVAARSPLATKLLTSVTGLGSATAALCFVGVCYLADWDDAFRHSLVALAISGVVVGTLMLTVQRTFPVDPVCLTDRAETVATSFPSGHAAAVTVYAMAARKSEHIPFSVVMVLAVLIAVSRVYLGTHFASDTVAGVGIGIVAFLLAGAVLQRFDPIAAGKRVFKPGH